MTISITVTGESVPELVTQMLLLLNAPSAGAPGFSQAANPAGTSPVQNANGLDNSTQAPQALEPAAATSPRGRGRPPKAAFPAAPTPQQPSASSSAPSAAADLQPAPPPLEPVVQGPVKSAQDVRHDAVLVLKRVYTKGPAGQQAVDRICQHFNVTKLVDVPLEKAVELLTLSNQALAALGG